MEETNRYRHSDKGGTDGCVRDGQRFPPRGSWPAEGLWDEKEEGALGMPQWH